MQNTEHPISSHSLTNQLLFLTANPGFFRMLEPDAKVHGHASHGSHACYLPEIKSVHGGADTSPIRMIEEILYLPAEVETAVALVQAEAFAD